MLSINFKDYSLPFSDHARSIVLFCDGKAFEHENNFQSFDRVLQGRLSQAVKAQDFEGEAGQMLSLLAPSEAMIQLHVVGVGKKEKETISDRVRFQQAGGNGFQLLKKTKLKESEAAFILPASLGAEAAFIAFGAQLGAYEFSLYHSNYKETAPKTLTVFYPSELSGPDLTKQWQPLQALGEGVTLTRNLVSEPANILYPESFRDRIENVQSLGLEIDVLDRAAMTELGFGALLGVAQGSAKPPFTVILRYQGAADKNDAPLAFIGKGVTFDSGGISIKPAAGMEEMKTDMGGAAAVVGVMSVLARRNAKINAVGVVGLVENMVSGEAQRPGDVVKSYSGQTIEVQNTDAEGRLVLADLLAYTKDKYAPSLMVNLATLTGAIVVALGHEYAGLFSNDDVLSKELEQAGCKTGEKLWRMPMGEAYNRRIDSDIADMKNIGGRPGSSSLAAEFLKRFVGDTPWAHLDIAGTAWCDKGSSCIPKGASGFGVQLLNEFVAKREK